MPGQLFFLYIFGAPIHKRQFSQMAVQKACGHDILSAIGLDRIQIV